MPSGKKWVPFRLADEEIRFVKAEIARIERFLRPCGARMAEEHLAPDVMAMVASNRLAGDDAKLLSMRLSGRLGEYPDDLVSSALAKHSEVSPFLPSLADLMVYIKPEMAERTVGLERLRRLLAFNETGEDPAAAIKIKSKPIASDAPKLRPMSEPPKVPKPDRNQTAMAEEQKRALELGNGDLAKGYEIMMEQE